MLQGRKKMALLKKKSEKVLNSNYCCFNFKGRKYLLRQNKLNSKHNPFCEIRLYFKLVLVKSEVTKISSRNFDISVETLLSVGTHLYISVKLGNVSVY